MQIVEGEYKKVTFNEYLICFLLSVRLSKQEKAL